MNQRDSRAAKWLGIICVVAGLSALGLEYIPVSESLEWHSLEEAQRVALGASKPVFVDVYADWCGPCRQMDRLVFTQDSVKALLNSDFIIAKVNIDDPNVGNTIREQYGVTSLPTFLLLSPNGGELKRVRGFQSATRLMAWLTDPSMLYIASWPIYAYALAESHHLRKPLLVLLIKSSASQREVNFFVDVPSVREEIENNFIRTMLVQTDPSHSGIIDDLKVRDYPLEEEEGLLLVLDWERKEQGRFILSSETAEDAQAVVKKLRELAQIVSSSDRPVARRSN